MTTELPKKRPWFRLHLSTCVMLMVVAGALVWANTKLRIDAERIDTVNTELIVVYQRGRPASALELASRCFAAC